MLRVYDWECRTCAYVREELVNTPAPKSKTLWCGRCQQSISHVRLLPLFAPYMGERVLNPMVHGGKFDTCGAEKAPDLPALPDGCSYDQAKSIFSSNEYKEIKRQRKEVADRNKAKKKRAQLIKSGASINMRRDRLPGDPKLTA